MEGEGNGRITGKDSFPPQKLSRLENIIDRVKGMNMEARKDALDFHTIIGGGRSRAVHRWIAGGFPSHVIVVRLPGNEVYLSVIDEFIIEQGEKRLFSNCYNAVIKLPDKIMYGYISEEFLQKYQQWKDGKFSDTP